MPTRLRLHLVPPTSGLSFPTPTSIRVDPVLLHVVGSGMQLLGSKKLGSIGSNCLVPFLRCVTWYKVFILSEVQDICNNGTHLIGQWVN